jgi:hypothetical protein
MGKYANCILLNRYMEVVDLLWSRERSDLCIGFNHGWYTGRQAVWDYYRARHERTALVASLLKKRFPQQLGNKGEKELFGAGVFHVKPLGCPVIEIAGDGKTARGLWYSQGTYGETYPWGPMSCWTWGYCAADLVMEGGEWRIWHLLCLDDVDARCGSSWGKDPAPPPEALPEFAALADFKMPEPNLPCTLRNYYNPNRPLTPAPDLPKPYPSFEGITGYGPPAGSPRAAEKISETAAEMPAPADDPVSPEDEECIRRVLDVEDIKTLVYKRVYYIAGDLRQEEMDELWVSGGEAQKSASFGRNWGWYTGMDEIRRYYVDAHKERLKKQMRENNAPALNTGNMYAHPASTGLVELAGDGKTARGIWYAIAQETTAKPGGTAEARWMLEKIAVDFLKEPEGWKIWHLMIASDLSCSAGDDYSAQPVYGDPSEDPIQQEFGKPTIPALVHDRTFNWWDNYPPVPEPYEHFSDTMGYGPKGYRPAIIKGFGAGEGRNYQ